MAVGSENKDLSLSAKLESLLFVADSPVTLGRLAEALDVSTETVLTSLERLESDYSSRGLRLQRSSNEVQMVTAPEAAGQVERFLGLSVQSRLSRAALETLAIVAYRQPVTRPEIDSVRGVNSDAVLRRLLSVGVIEELGRAPTVGRPILYGTSFEFLQHFGLRSLDDLPPLDASLQSEDAC
jgi:segregation and condensation protein B